MTNTRNHNMMRKGLGRAQESEGVADRILERMEEMRARKIQRIKQKQKRRAAITLPKLNLPEWNDEAE